MKPDRIDGYLSGKAQKLWRTAVIICRTVDNDGNGTREEWLVRGRMEGDQTLPDLGLGDSFARANQSICALVRAQNARDFHGGKNDPAPKP